MVPIVTVFPALALGNIVITLEPTDASALPAAPGAVVEIQVLLSVDEADNPLDELRLIQFAFANTYHFISRAYICGIHI